MILRQLMILTNGQLEMNVEFPLKYFRGISTAINSLIDVRSIFQIESMFAHKLRIDAEIELILSKHCFTSPNQRQN